MSAVYTLLLPRVTAATITPNPAATDETLLLAVTVIEETIELEPTYYYSGEIFAGEV